MLNRQTMGQNDLQRSEPSFSDGTLAVVAGDSYYLVHKGFIERVSEPLRAAICRLGSAHLLEGCPALVLEENATDAHQFLRCLYDGIEHLACSTPEAFPLVSALLHMSTKYEVRRLRQDLLKTLSCFWPTTLAQWDVREANATFDGIYDPRRSIPHPIMIIRLARMIDAPALLPSAFYDLSRCPPDEIVSGFIDSARTLHNLPDEDKLAALQGREHLSRFLSTFIATQLEGRSPASACLHRNESELVDQRRCQAAFEATTFQVLRQANTLHGRHSADPLFTIYDADFMPSPHGAAGIRHHILPACAYCQQEFQMVCNDAREDLWYHLPSWFSLETTSNWG